ncbi:MAG: SH3 domain-containing protein [Treponema sp.]|nr:SH3 domain-containing protein [Treponema sp.]MCL2251012.1 SH3 domain-containing protein [Treponema sp.]
MIFKYKHRKVLLFLFLLLVFLLSSCSKMGYGILLWSIDEPPILSGTILPVYIRSNIEKKYVVGIPEALREENGFDKIEVPLSQFEFVGSKKKTQLKALEFNEFAQTYAENLQDALPIRDNTDNNSRRVYRLRVGEIIKILAKVKGNPPIGTSGDPLVGDWYKVLTKDGITGYCFSNRLKLFNQNESIIQTTDLDNTETLKNPDLDLILSRRWSPDFYLQMINSRKINIQSLEKRYRFDPGQDTGIARIILPDTERQFEYDRIISDGERAFSFEGKGSTLQMLLRPNNSLSVQFLDSSQGGNTGTRRTLIFVSLPTDVNDIILQENARREEIIMNIYNQGPVFTSNNFGTITLRTTGDFTWTGFDLLVPQLFPEETNGTGRISMDLYISPSYEDRFNGAFTLQFTDIRSNNNFYFLYVLDNQGLRLEVIPDYGIDDITVMRRDSSPLVLYFFKDSD